MPALALLAILVPAAIAFAVGPALADFFDRSNTPDPVAWMFLGFLLICFGILPAVGLLGAFLRSRRGATIVTVSPRGLRVQERGAWTTRTAASLEAADIVDVDYEFRKSRLVQGRGVIVKGRGGLTLFAQGLDDEEIRYLHAVIRMALAGRT